MQFHEGLALASRMNHATRIVSLLPAATEIVAALGCAQQLVGRSHECDFPAGLEHVAVLTHPSLEAAAGSAAIDAEVVARVARALAIFELDLEGLRAVRPDLILTQDLCSVCAVSAADVTQALRALGLEHCTVLSLAPTRLDAILGDLRRVADALGALAAGRRLLEVLEARIQRVRGRTVSLPRRLVLTLEWLAPPIVGGLWMADLIELAGGEALATRAGEPGRPLDRHELASLHPDVIVLKPCGYPIARTLAEPELLREVLGQIGGPAVQEGEVWIADGNAFFNRPGPRIVDSLEILGCCVHPEAFPDLAERRRPGFERLR